METVTPGAQQQSRSKIWGKSADDNPVSTTGGTRAKSRRALGRSGTINKLNNLASLLNSQAYRNGTPKERRKSTTAVDNLLRMDAQITTDELHFVRQLGEGAFATVDLCEYNPKGDSDGLPAVSAGMLIALKQLKRQVPTVDPNNPGRLIMSDVPLEDLETFKEEALVLKALRHPNVVACYGIVLDGVSRQLDFEQGVWTPTMFLLEYCEGGSLLDMVRHPRSYTAREAIRWCAEVARGMNYLHSRKGVKVAHRDLKLENILLSGGCAKVGFHV
mgnify:CR=1 FL=1